MEEDGVGEVVVFRLYNRLTVNVQNVMKTCTTCTHLN